MNVDHGEITDPRSSQLSGGDVYDEELDEHLDLPLSEIMRPASLEDYVGQHHLLNDENGLVKNFVRLGYLPSMILYGPPGVGKTTLASILADEVGYLFIELSATDSSILDLRQLLEALKVENIRRQSRDEDALKMVVFIDEIHRFQKNQQDFLLPLVEAGHFTFIGATTVNPKVRIRKAILSRCQLFPLHRLTDDDLQRITTRAVLTENIRRRSLYNLGFITFTANQRNMLIEKCLGDSRLLINLIEAVSANCIGEAYQYVKGNQYPIAIPDEMLEVALLTLENTSTASNSRLAFVYKKLFELMNFNLKHSDPPEYSKVQEPTPLVQQTQIATAPSDRHTKRRRVETNGDPEKIDCFYTTFELGYVLPKDNEKEKRYARQMEVSDSSDEDNVPETFLSDSIETYGPYQDLSALFNSTMGAIYMLLYLLDKKESPFAIAKQLILFTVLHTDSDKSQLIKTMALVKGLKAANVNVKKLFSNCVERLTKVKKKKSDIDERIQLAEIFLIGDNDKTSDPTGVLSDPTVDYDRELVKLLLQVPPKQTYSDCNSLKVGPLVLGDDFTVGQPFSDRELESEEVLARLEKTLGVVDCTSIFSTYPEDSLLSTNRNSTYSAQTVDTLVFLEDILP